MKDTEMSRDDLFAEYAAGTLHPALKLMVEAQTFLDAESARDDGLAAAIGGAHLEMETPAEMSPDALETALSRVRDSDMSPPLDAARRASSDIATLAAVPDPLIDLAIDAAATRGWRSPMKGLRRLRLMQDGDLTAELIAVDAGVGVPPHGHTGREYTLCLKGKFKQGGKVYDRGDLIPADPSIVHAPKAEPGEDVLVFAVTEGPLRYQGVIGLAQKILRFH